MTHRPARSKEEQRRSLLAPNTRGRPADVRLENRLLDSPVMRAEFQKMGVSEQAATAQLQTGSRAIVRRARYFFKWTADADDCIQTAAMGVVDAVTQGKYADGNFGGYCSQVTTYVALNQLKQLRRDQARTTRLDNLEEAPAPVDGGPATHQEGVEWASVLAIVLDAIDGLGRDGEALALWEVAGLSTEEVAAALAISKDKVRKAVYRARKALEAALNTLPAMDREVLQRWLQRRSSGPTTTRYVDELSTSATASKQTEKRDGTGEAAPVTPKFGTATITAISPTAGKGVSR